jgi:hypothetical protein
MNMIDLNKFKKNKKGTYLLTKTKSNVMIMYRVL